MPSSLWSVHNLIYSKFIKLYEVQTPQPGPGQEGLRRFISSMSDIESGVSSLLRSCGRLKGSLLPSYLDKTITYKDKDYESATEALEAYISDFESSHQTGRLKLPVTSHTDTHFFGECVNSTELDFLSGHRHREPDIFSMTTEELLTLPYDGSLPVTHTSAHNLQDLLSETDLCAKRPGCIQCLTRDQLYTTTRHREHRSVLDVLRQTESLCPIHRDSKTHGVQVWLNDPCLTPMTFDPSHALDHTAPSWLRDIEEEDGVMKSKQGCEKEMRQTVERDSCSEQDFQAGDLLGADRWWENPVTFKSPVPVEDAIDNENITQTLTDTAGQTAGRKHPGPVETLKHMLFNMQAAHSQVCETQLKDVDSGGLSIQRALYHLDHLKSLVEEKERKEK